MPSRSSFFMLLSLSLALSTGVLSPLGALAADDAPAIQIPQTIGGGIPLLEKIGSLSNVPVTQGFGTLLTYINDIADWLLLVAGGICVLWVLVGGMQMMLSGLDNSLQSKGKESMKWAIIGLVILLFSGFILRTLNSMFFK
ncbi:MAG: pilin [Candidatus Peregrinibacteria bacterium]